MNPYEAPRSHSAPSTTPDLDIDSASTPNIAKVGGGVVLFTGVVLVLMAAQALASVRIYGVMRFAPYVLLALGAALAPLGVFIFRASGWAPWPSAVLATVALFLTGFWLVWTFANGFLALFALIAPPFSACSLALSALAAGPCRKVADARARLAAAGLGFGL